MVDTFFAYIRGRYILCKLKYMVVGGMSVGEKIKYEGPGKKYKREVKREIKNLVKLP